MWKPYILLEKIEEFLAVLAYPLHFLDFETLMIAVPLYNQVSPYKAIPFQFSLHVIKAPGKRSKHYSFLDYGSIDPRPRSLARLRKLIIRTA